MKPAAGSGQAARHALPSLRRMLLGRVLVPVAASWLAATVVAVGVAQYSAQRAFDRSMLDDAFVIGAHVRADQGRPVLGLNRRELTTVLFDQAETVYFSVRDAQDRLVAGHGGLRMLPAQGEGWQFGNIAFEGRLLRAVTLHREEPVPVDVTVAQTTRARDALFRHLLLLSLLPQTALLLLLAGWLGRRIAGATRPLADLERLVEDRSADDLAPVAVHAGTHDVAALAGAINALLARLQRSVQAQREFSGNVAHELRTPLAGIRALAEYGLAQDDPARWREQLQAILASQERASGMVDKLLALALAQEAQARLQVQPLRLDAIVRELLLRYLPRAQALGVDLGAQGIDDAPHTILGDRTLVEGILTNLIDNALRYGLRPEGGSMVTVSLARTGEDLVLSVEDNGPGAPGPSQAQLAARGSRGEAAQLLAQGAGLGLALVAQYAALMHGRMDLASGPGGRGWVCRVVFPAQPA